MFRLEAVGEVPGNREARLVVPGRETESGPWRLVVDGDEQSLPPECVVVFSGGSLTNQGRTA
jgi:hypothetical protein